MTTNTDTTDSFPDRAEFFEDATGDHFALPADHFALPGDTDTDLNISELSAFRNDLNEHIDAYIKHLVEAPSPTSTIDKNIKRTIEQTYNYYYRIKAIHQNHIETDDEDVLSDLSDNLSDTDFEYGQFTNKKICDRIFDIDHPNTPVDTSVDPAIYHAFDTPIYHSFDTPIYRSLDTPRKPSNGESQIIEQIDPITVEQTNTDHIQHNIKKRVKYINVDDSICTDMNIGNSDDDNDDYDELISPK